MSANIVSFLLKRVAEDEAAANAATAGPWVAGIKRKGEPGRWTGIGSRSVLAARDQWRGDEDVPVADADSQADVDHIARHDPARVLAQCAAYRAIVGMLVTRDEQDHPAVAAHATGLRLAVKSLASIWSEHPEYDEAWRS